MSQSPIETVDGSLNMGALFADPATGATRREVPQPEVLFEPDTPARLLYYIESGQVRMYQIGPDNAARLVDILGAGEWFGIASLARAHAFGARAAVVSSSVLLELPAEKLLALLLVQPRAAVELVVQLAGWLQAATEAASGLIFNDCNQRLVQTLLRFSRTAAATAMDDGAVELHITHQQLAQAVGAARETVSLALTQLRRRNLLRTGRNRLLFNPEVLRQFTQRAREAPPGAKA